LDAGVDASKNPPFWTDATKIREEPSEKNQKRMVAASQSIFTTNRSHAEVNPLR